MKQDISWKKVAQSYLNLNISQTQDKDINQYSSVLDLQTDHQ
jgi:hypothetical protein